jgi:hypothetical protein
LILQEKKHSAVSTQHSAREAFSTNEDASQSPGWLRACPETLHLIQQVPKMFPG